MTEVHVLLLAGAACRSASPTGDTPDTDGGPSDSETTAATPITDWVARSEGSWSGTADPSPVGPIPFALTFAWDKDGELAASTASSGFEFEYTYFRRPSGEWRLTEVGRITGGFEQRYTLEPVETDDPDVVEWVYADDPDLLTLVITATADQLRMEATVRGATHAVIDLDPG